MLIITLAIRQMQRQSCRMRYAFAIMRMLIDYDVMPQFTFFAAYALCALHAAD